MPDDLEPSPIETAPGSRVQIMLTFEEPVAGAGLKLRNIEFTDGCTKPDVLVFLIDALRVLTIQNAEEVQMHMAAMVAKIKGGGAVLGPNGMRMN